jgi:hypothetical protein
MSVISKPFSLEGLTNKVNSILNRPVAEVGAG